MHGVARSFRLRGWHATLAMTKPGTSGHDACRDKGVRFSITVRQHASLRNIIAAIPEADWTPIPYLMDGAADVAETEYTPFGSEPDAVPVRLIVRRVKPTPGSQLALFTTYSYHAFITDRAGDTLELEADHRRHAEIENVIRDLKYDVGLNHLPSGLFPAYAARLAPRVSCCLLPGDSRPPPALQAVNVLVAWLPHPVPSRIGAGQGHAPSIQILLSLASSG